MSLPSIGAFFFLVFALSWGLQIAAIQNVGDLENEAAIPYLIAAMFVPALITFLFVLPYRALRATLLWRPAWAMWPLLVVGALVPTAIAFGVVAVATFMGWGHSGWFAFAETGVEISGGPWLLGRGHQPWGLFTANVALTGIAFAAMNALAAMGEEIGWRGFIQGHLIDRFGSTAAITLLGFMWSMWHLPGQLAGYNFPDYPELGALVLSPLELIAVSFFLGWLTLQARSFWPAAIAHGAGNSIQEGVTANLQLAVPRIYEDLTTLTLTIVVGLICWAMVRERQPAPSPA
ncbi:MAG: CPBP family intramembrane metalloprotease [Alphaproteobacteria bacterium]|nr:CPBP family intramembrane metalloprotease [Alphaproteobacteria bacterium]